MPADDTALLPDGWCAELIVARSGEIDGGDTTPGEQAVPPERPLRFRRDFTTNAPAESAVLFVTACGLFVAEIDGQVVGDHVLSPGWTSFRHRHRVLDHDVTSLVGSPGPHAIGITVGEGWYRGTLGGGAGQRETYGEHLGPIAQLVITYADGSTSIVATDPSWTSRPSPVLHASLYDGETVDLAEAERQQGWSTPGGGRRGLDGWTPVEVVAFVQSPLFVSTTPPVRRHERFRPVTITTSPSDEGKVVVDFGQNIAGWVEVQVPGGQVGREIVLRHAEILQGGEIDTRSLRQAKATETIRMGKDPAVYEPSFTYHGFRYVEVDGWPVPGGPQPDDLTAIACYSDIAEIGTFACSDSRLNQLHHNVRWSTKGNFVDVPTDCPQRNERLGWTGDIQLFAPVAAFLYDCDAFLGSWLDDLAAEQEQYGTVPPWIPWLERMGWPPIPTAVWGDAAVVVPWVLYEHFGDEAALRHRYPSMRQWVDHIAARVGDTHLWDGDWQFGDWLDPTAPPEAPNQGATDTSLLATAYHAYSTRLVAQAAGALGLAADQERYTTLADEIAAAFAGAYVTSSGRLTSDSQTAYALALRFGLLPTDDLRSAAAARLRDLVAGAGYHVGTGLVGTPLLCEALTDAGFVDDAYRLLLQESVPSWLYAVTMGATTIWEKWEGLRPDGTLNPNRVTSFNHYALGAVADFLHGRVAGLAPGAPGYRVMAVRPRPGGGLTWAEASRLVDAGDGYGSNGTAGRARVRGERTGAELHVEVDVPPGCSALVQLPDGSEPFELSAGGHRRSCSFRPAADDPR